MKSTLCSCKKCQCDPCECSDNHSCSENSSCSSTWCNWKNATMLFGIAILLFAILFFFVKSVFPIRNTETEKTLTQATETPQDAMMREHCKMMPEMQ